MTFCGFALAMAVVCEIEVGFDAIAARFGSWVLRRLKERRGGAQESQFSQEETQAVRSSGGARGDKTGEGWMEASKTRADVRSRC